MSQLQDYKTSFPKWSGEGLKKAVPQLDENGLDLLEHELQTVITLGLPLKSKICNKIRH